MIKTEKHKFDDFIPEDIRFLLLGSFSSNFVAKGKQYDWYYSNGRSQFWKLISQVYDRELTTKEQKIQLCKEIGLGIADIIYECERTKASSLDVNLQIVSLNPNIDDYCKMGIKKIYFTSRYVEKLYNKHFKHLVTEFPNIELIYLPSPSPRYVAISKEEKLTTYKNVLPSLT